MPINIKSSIDYQQVCNELGISISDLMSLAQNKQAITQGKNIKLSEVIGEYLNTLEQKVKTSKRSIRTFTTYKNFLKRLETFANTKNPEFTIEMLTEMFFYDFMETSKPRKNPISHSPYTTNKYLSIIRSLLKFAVINNYINQDLRYRFDFDKTKLIPRYFSEEQIEKILEVVLKRTYGYRWRTMVIFLLATGCRVNEITNIKVRDFDINTNLTFVNGKGNKDRYIPIYPQLKKVVLRYLDMTHLSKWDMYNDGYLFSRDEGDKRLRKISNRSLQYQISNILQEIGLGNEHYSTHSFRHTFAVRSLKAGMDLPYLTQLLGHNSPHTTSIYLQMLPVDLRDEVMQKYPFPFEDLLKEII